MHNETEETLIRIAELEQMVSILGDSIVSYGKAIENIQGEVNDLKGKLAYTRGMIKDFIRCASQMENV
jgi:hypothetical protein